MSLENLKNEGIPNNRVFLVGNVMIDSLIHYMPKIENSHIFKSLNLIKKKYILITFHRPRNVDTKENLIKLIDFLNNLGIKRKVIFPIHPRTEENLKEYGLTNSFSADIASFTNKFFNSFRKRIKSSLVIFLIFSEERNFNSISLFSK